MKLFFVLFLALVLVFSVLVQVEASPTPPALPTGGDDRIKKIVKACATENMGKIVEAKEKGGEDQVKNIIISCVVDKIEKAAAAKGCSNKSS